MPPEIDALMQQGLCVYRRLPGWEGAECLLTDQLKHFDSREAFVAAVWLSLILHEWDVKRFLSAGAYQALIEYSLHASARGFYPSVIGMMRLLKKSAVLQG